MYLEGYPVLNRVNFNLLIYVNRIVYKKINGIKLRVRQLNWPPAKLLNSNHCYMYRHMRSIRYMLFVQFDSNGKNLEFDCQREHKRYSLYIMTFFMSWRIMGSLCFKIEVKKLANNH